MSLRTVTEKYALDTHRTRSLWVATGLFVLVFGFLGWTGAYSYRGDLIPLSDGGIGNAAAFLVPLATLALGHGAVAGERESGALRVLLSFPHSRRDVVAGAFLGRLAALLTAVGAGLLAGAAAYTVRTGGLPEAEFLVLAGFVLLWTLFGSALAVGLSALVATGRRAIGAGLGIYLIFLTVWQFLATELVRRTYPSEQQYPLPEWVQIWSNLDPVSAFNGTTRLLRYRPDEALAFYETMPFSAAVLVGWTLLLLALALWRFPRTDL